MEMSLAVEKGLQMVTLTELLSDFSMVDLWALSMVASMALSMADSTVGWLVLSSADMKVVERVYLMGDKMDMLKVEPKVLWKGDWKVVLMVLMWVDKMVSHRVAGSENTMATVSVGYLEA